MPISNKELERVKKIQRSINNQYKGRIVENVNFIVYKLETTVQERDFFYKQTEDRKEYEKYLKDCIASGVRLIRSYEHFVTNTERVL